MRVATLSRLTIFKPLTILALAAIVLVVTGAAALDTDRSELKESSNASYVCAWSTGTSDSVNEGTTAVETLAATSNAGGSCSYSIVGGSDSNDFSLSGANLAFSSSPDYESPADSDSNNIYVVQLRTTDSADSATTDLTMTVTVNDLTLAITGSQSFLSLIHI